MELSVLDAVPIRPGVTPHQAVQWTTDVARAAERLGYHRLWLVEHHAAVGIGCSAPAVMMAHVAAHTTTLRIGSGGVMLPNHAPLVVAGAFSMLEALHPGRIDLGVGRSNGADPSTTSALGVDPDSRTSRGFQRRLDDLLVLLEGRSDGEHPLANTHLPLRTRCPPVFVLGTSPSSARVAAVRGLPYAFAHHLDPPATRASLEAYRASFRPRSPHARPHAVVSVLVVCAATPDEAMHAALTASILRMRKVLVHHRGIALDDETLLALEWTADERRVAAEGLEAAHAVIGDAGQVADRLRALQHESGADELMLAMIEYEGSARIRTLTCVAQGR